MVGDRLLFIKQELWVLKQEGSEHEPGFHHAQKVVTYFLTVQVDGLSSIPMIWGDQTYFIVFWERNHHECPIQIGGRPTLLPGVMIYSEHISTVY